MINGERREEGRLQLLKEGSRRRRLALKRKTHTFESRG